MIRAQFLDRIGRVILRPRSTSARVLITLVMLAIATAVRWLVDRGANGVPYLTFVPVVLFAALGLGSRYALACALAALVIVRIVFPGSSWQDATPSALVALLLLFWLTVGLIVITGHLVRQILIENQAHIAQAEAFNAELQHRAKNALQILRALAGRGPAPGEDAATFHATLLARMEALAKADELLRFGALETAALHDLVATAIAPFGPVRFHCTGPDCRLDKSAVTPLVMVLHELGTNAVKYGALSATSGTVSLTWRAPQGRRLALEWRERGGPPVSKPQTRGMGTRLLRPHSGLTALEMEWDPAGLVCRLEVVGQPVAPPSGGRCGGARDDTIL